MVHGPPPLSPYRVCASVPPDPPDPDVVRYAARVRDERRRSALRVGVLLAVTAAGVFLAMTRAKPHGEPAVAATGYLPVRALPMPPPILRAWNSPQVARVAFMRRVANDIGDLGVRYPELAGFDVETDFHAGALEISYILPRASPIAGATTDVHPPEPEGLYLYVRMVEYASRWRLDTQVSGYPRKRAPGKEPFVPPLEGPGGPTVYGALREVLERHEREASWVGA